jgi:hypothetical protein
MSWVAVGVAGATLVGGIMGSQASKSAANKQAQGAKEASQMQLGMFNRTQNNLSPWLDTGTMSLQALSQGAGLGGGGEQPLTEADVRKIYQRYMGRPVGAEEMQSLMAGNKTPAQLEKSVASSPEHLFHVNKERSVSPVSQPLYQEASANKGAAGVGFGALTKPFGMEDFQASPAYQFNLAEGEKAINKAAAARGKFYAPGTLQDISKFSQGLASNEFQNAYSNYNTNMGNIWSRLSTLAGGGQNAAAGLGTNATAVAGQIGNNIMGGANAQAAGQVGSANALSNGMSSAYNNYVMQQILAGNQQSSVPKNYANMPPADPSFQGMGGAPY